MHKSVQWTFFSNFSIVTFRSQVTQVFKHLALTFQFRHFPKTDKKTFCVTRSTLKLPYKQSMRFIAFAFNEKSFVIACFFSLPRRCFRKRLAKDFLCKYLTSVTLEACDLDRTCFLRHTAKYFVGDLFTVT